MLLNASLKLTEMCVEEAEWHTGRVALLLALEEIAGCQFQGEL